MEVNNIFFFHQIDFPGVKCFHQHWGEKKGKKKKGEKTKVSYILGESDTGNVEENFHNRNYFWQQKRL